MDKQRTAVWLPSPLGDAVMATPALKAIREHLSSAEIYFVASSGVRSFLSPSRYNDEWIEIAGGNPFRNAAVLRKHSIDSIVLMKNSFSCALAVFLAGIDKRVGYARDGRGFLLTDRLFPAKDEKGRFRPGPMIDYYLALAEKIGAEPVEKTMSLEVDPQAAEQAAQKLTFLGSSAGPLVILVPGGAFGPSKLWPGERFAAVADVLIEKYSATVIVSVAPNEAERAIADEICSKAEHKIFSLADNPLKPGLLKALFARADLVVSNDTGPRHIAVALGRRIITLFGPNNPEWTVLNYPDEIMIRGSGPCVPCDKPKCEADEHCCMLSITPEMVLEKAEQMLATAGHRQ